MGIFKAVFGSVQGVMADQWKEYFYCDAIPSGMFGVRGKKRVSDRSSNTKTDDNVISDGSCIVVADGQMAIAVEGGRAFACWTEPGEHIFHSNLSSSVFEGGGLRGVLHQVGQRVAFGGDAPLMQRIYYFSTLESGSMSFETPDALPFRVQGGHADFAAGVLCSGSFTYRLTDPVRFYNTVCGNFTDSYPRSRLASQMHSEFLTTLQQALGQLAETGLRPSELPAHTEELCETLKALWSDQRGLELVSIALQLRVQEQDLREVRELQREAVLCDPARAAAAIAHAQGTAMQQAAASDGRAAPVIAEVPPAGRNWVCACGRINHGNFCEDCGRKRPD